MLKKMSFDLSFCLTQKVIAAAGIDVINVFNVFLFLFLFLFLSTFLFKKRSLKIPPRSLKSTFETTEMN